MYFIGLQDMVLFIERKDGTTFHQIHWQVAMVRLGAVPRDGMIQQ
jgi:hypothetical protein